MAEEADVLAMFAAEARAIPGVLAAEFGGETVKVYVADRFSPVAEQVYRLDDRMRDTYPEARFDLWISESQPSARPRRRLTDGERRALREKWGLTLDDFKP